MTLLGLGLWPHKAGISWLGFTLGSWLLTPQCSLLRSIRNKVGISRTFDILTKEINQRECNVMTQAATLE